MPTPQKFEHVDLIMNEETRLWIEQEQRASRVKWWGWLVALPFLPFLFLAAILLGIWNLLFWRPKP